MKSRLAIKIPTHYERWSNAPPRGRLRWTTLPPGQEKASNAWGMPGGGGGGMLKLRFDWYIRCWREFWREIWCVCWIDRGLFCYFFCHCLLCFWGRGVVIVFYVFEAEGLVVKQNWHTLIIFEAFWILFPTAFNYWFLQLWSCFIKWQEKEWSIKLWPLCIHKCGKCFETS